MRYRLGNIVRDLSYDEADRIKSYTHYDAASAAAQPSLDQNFSYDANGRLTAVSTASASWSISYDPNGNRTSVSLNGSPSSYTTEATSNRLKSTSNPARNFTHDSAGNTTADSTSYTASYDLAGRLSSLTKAGTTSSYSYNAQGQRVRKSSGSAGSTTVFVYDQGGQLLGEYDATGAAIKEYVWLGSTPVAFFTPDAIAANPPQVFYIHADHIDTPRVVTDQANNVRWKWLAEPFGTTAPETNPSGLGVLTLNLRFPGQYFDQESGLSDNWHRSYDSTIGRYNTSDPIGLAGGINTYAYVGGNPLSGVDPNGLFQVPTAGQMSPIMARALARAGVVVLAGGGPENPLADAGALAVGVGSIAWELWQLSRVPKPVRSPEDEREAQAEHDWYKSVCDQKRIPTGDKCLDILNDANQQYACAKKMADWDDRWGGGARHKADIESRTRGWKSRMEDYKKCKAECK